MEAVNVDRLFVVTGGPGSGKSTLIAALAGHGIRSMPEAGRAIRWRLAARRYHGRTGGPSLN